MVPPEKVGAVLTDTVLLTICPPEMGTAVIAAVVPADPVKRTVTLPGDWATIVPPLTVQLFVVQELSVKLAVEPPRRVSAPERRQGEAAEVVP